MPAFDQGAPPSASVTATTIAPPASASHGPLESVSAAMPDRWNAKWGSALPRMLQRATSAASDAGHTCAPGPLANARHGALANARARSGSAATQAASVQASGRESRERSMAGARGGAGPRL